MEDKGICKDTPINHFKKLGWLPSDSLVAKMTRNAENYTPAMIVEKVKQAMGDIDLDPASCEMAQETIQAKKYYTQENNGLSKKWSGHVFLNPPYGFPEIQKFIDKLLQELPNLKSAILLTNDQTDTDWWQKCAKKSTLFCLPDGRIRFYTPTKEKTSPTNGQTIFYFGKNEKKFKNAFRDVGLFARIIP